MLKRDASLNPDFFFGLYAHPLAGTVAIVISLTALVVLMYRQAVIRSFLILVAVGALSNIIDRLLYGGAVDYFVFWLIPRFNLADIIITLGLFGAGLKMLKPLYAKK